MYHLAAAVAAMQGKLRWLVLPKLHLLHHICDDLLVNFLNPRAFHCFSGESYMGFVKKVCQATCMATNMEARVLKRTLLKVLTGCRDEITGKIL